MSGKYDPPNKEQLLADNPRISSTVELMVAAAEAQFPPKVKPEGDASCAKVVICGLIAKGKTEKSACIRAGISSTAWARRNEPTLGSVTALEKREMIGRGCATRNTLRSFTEANRQEQPEERRSSLSRFDKLNGWCATSQRVRLSISPLSPIRNRPRLRAVQFKPGNVAAAGTGFRPDEEDSRKTSNDSRATPLRFVPMAAMRRRILTGAVCPLVRSAPSLGRVNTN